MNLSLSFFIVQKKLDYVKKCDTLKNNVKNCYVVISDIDHNIFTLK